MDWEEHPINADGPRGQPGARSDQPTVHLLPTRRAGRPAAAGEVQ